jgi:hypothetical protein
MAESVDKKTEPHVELAALVVWDTAPEGLRGQP